MQRELQAMMPGTACINARPMSTVLEPLIRPWTLGASMLSIFGGIALLLAAIGLYGVIAYNVAQRTHEMGVRVALGARGTDIVRLVLRQGLRLAIAGGAIGALIAIGAGSRIEPLLFNVSPRDPMIVGGALVVIVVMSIVACALPARRATRVDPVEALRTE